MKTFITFGQDHRHEIQGKILDKDCVAVIEGPNATINRERAFELFGDKFAFEYPSDCWREEYMKHYPRGYIQVAYYNPENIK